MFFFFFFNDTATTEIYTLSLHDALPISPVAPTITRQPASQTVSVGQTATFTVTATGTAPLSYRWQKNGTDRKSTRLNSSHLVISYAVFCLKKKKKHASNTTSDHMAHASY